MSAEPIRYQAALAARVRVEARADPRPPAVCGVEIDEPVPVLEARVPDEKVDRHRPTLIRLQPRS
jgi:hypothetical protein